MFDNLYNTLIQIGNKVVGIPDKYFIRAGQLNAPAPIGSYGDVDFTTFINISSGDYEYNNVDVYKNKQNINVVMTYNFYRTNARFYAQAVYFFMKNPNVIETFKNNNLGFILLSDLRNISQSDQESYEERSQFDITLNTQVDILTEIKSIEELQITAEINNLTSEIDVDDPKTPPVDVPIPTKKIRKRKHKRKHKDN